MIRWVTAFVLVLTTALHAAEPRMMIVSIDGLRPDCLLRADAPNLKSLVENGAFSFWANTTPVAITLPSHASMLTGVIVERHGIQGNDDNAAANEKLLVPSIFDLANQAGISTGMSAGKSKFSMFAKSIDHSWTPAESKTKDEIVGDHAVEIILQHQPRLMFVHFPGADSSGHSKGWGGPEQLATIAEIDKQLGRVFAAMVEAKVREDTIVLISADHGGMGKKHGSANALHATNQSIPWIIAGPGIRKDVDLTLSDNPKIQTYDTFATACKVFGLQVPDGIDGKVVTAAFEGELMTATPSTQPIPRTSSTAPTTTSSSSDDKYQLITATTQPYYTEWKATQSQNAENQLK